MKGKAHWIALFLMMSLATFAFAQTETGTIVGTVTDPGGAVVPNARVTATGVNTGVARTTTTTGTGLYTFANLQPGLYEVTVEGEGFAPFRQRVNLSVGARSTLDARLQPAGVGETIEVVATGGMAEVNVSSQTVGQVVDTTSIVQMPTLTRNPYDLVQTAGNVASDPAGATDRGAGVAMGGQRAASTNILLDGGENVDTFTAVVGQQVPLDAVQEFSVLTSNFTAEFGRASGGIVNVATKSGTNNFHGSLYHFYRGARLSAHSPELKAQGDPKGNFVRNQPGYSIGGPVMRDNMFFFSSTEWIRVRSTTTRNYIIPSPQLISASAAPTQSFFNAYGTLLPQATVVGTVTKAEAGAAVACPAGVTGPWCDLPGTFPAFQQVAVPLSLDAGGGTPQNTWFTVNRLDWNLTQRTQLYGRYAYESSDFFQVSFSDSPYSPFNTGAVTRNHNALLSLTHLFGATVATQSKVVFNRLLSEQPIAEPEGFTPTLFYRGSASSILGMAAVMPGYLPRFPGSAIPFGGPQNLYQFYQDVSVTRGNHQFRFGGMYIHMRDNRTFGAYANSPQELGSNIPGGLNNLILGEVVRFRTAVDPQGALPCPFNYTTGVRDTTNPACQVQLPAQRPRFNRNNRFNDMAFYAQDSWRVHPRFTLNLGVRWEYFGVQHNADPELDANFYFGPGTTFWERYRAGNAMRAVDSPIGALWEPDYNNWAPRLGFAWDLFGDGRTALRGGWGMSYERNFGNVTFNVIQNPPNYAVVALTPATVGGPIPVATDPLGPFAGTSGQVPLPQVNLRHVTQDIDTAYAHFWSMALERQLFRNSVLALEYVGSRGVKLYSLEDPNRLGSGVIYLGDNPNAFPGAELTQLNMTYGIGSFNRANRGFSYYNALNVRFQASNIWEKGLQFSTNYTWGHAQDNLSSTFSDAFTNYNTGLLDPFNPRLDYGNADFDIRHRLVMSGVWDIPWGKNSENWLVRNVIGGWGVAPIFTAQTGAPYTLFDFTHGFVYAPRALVTGGVQGGDQGASIGTNLYSWHNVPVNVGGYFNPITGFAEHGNCTTPGQGAIAPCPWPENMMRRNALRQPGLWNVNLGVHKNMRLTERVGLQLRGEFFNAFNHPNAYIDAGNLDVSGSTGTHEVGVKRGFTPAGLHDKRNIQIGAKFTF